MAARSARFGEHEHTDREQREERNPRTYNEAVIDVELLLSNSRRTAAAIANTLTEIDTRIQRRRNSRG